MATAAACVVCVLLMVASAPAHADGSSVQAVEEPSGTPPLSPPRLVGELAVGGALGAVGATAGLLVGVAAITNCQGVSCGSGTLFFTTGAGLALGASAGVYLAGATGRETGSFVATLGGAAAGTVAALLTANELDKASFDHHRGAAVAVLLTLPAVGAVTGFNLTREYRHAQVITASVGPGSIGIAGTF